PTIAYLSRRYFGIVASTSCRGNGMRVSPLTGPRPSRPHAGETPAFRLPQSIELQRGVVEHRILLIGRIVLGDALERVPQIGIAAHPLVDREVAFEHRAVGTEGGDAGVEIRAPRLGQLLR